MGATDTYVCLMTHITAAGGTDQIIREGDRLIGSHADVVANADLYIIDGSDADEIVAARHALHVAATAQE